MQKHHKLLNGAERLMYRGMYGEALFYTHMAGQIAQLKGDVVTHEKSQAQISRVEGLIREDFDRYAALMWPTYLDVPRQRRSKLVIKQYSPHYQKLDELAGQVMTEASRLGLFSSG